MTSRITITPVDNIRNFAVIDNNKVEVREADYNMDTFEFYNLIRQESRRSNLNHFSLYDDLIVENGTKYKVLQMLTK